MRMVAVFSVGEVMEINPIEVNTLKMQYVLRKISEVISSKNIMEVNAYGIIKLSH